ncbi:hypothetical protein [Herbiconiux ginsengi]|uniref:Uncharacterized protein n=1 Tax=Herbiconiux ginsengi TaxID=381665 RepID=A0A1H3RN93_9MICO|nr:hypothetical protein [Herbiconiux ginsengi]SDZ26369.1 hypothetical protein SAMN05216554_2895 [Herbiconiux ginsengi]
MTSAVEHQSGRIDEPQIDDAVAELLRARAVLRSRGETTLGGRVVLLAAARDAELPARALLRISVHELTLWSESPIDDGIVDALVAANPSRRIRAVATASLDMPWRSAHGVLDARPGVEPLPLPLAALAPGSWVVRAEASAAGFRLVVD